MTKITHNQYLRIQKEAPSVLVTSTSNGKLDFNDFSALTEEMTIYCNRDVDLTTRLFLFLLEKPNLPSWEVIELEHQAATIIAEQTTAGFYFDYEKARKLNTSLLKEKGELARELATMFSPKFLKDGKVKTYKKLSTTRKYIPNKTYKGLWDETISRLSN